ncbi:hypothetical protein [Xanthobacter sp. ZOL 2024]
MAAGFDEGSGAFLVARGGGLHRMDQHMKIFHTRDISFNDAVLRIRYPDRVVEREVGPGLPALGLGWQAVSAVCLGGVLHIRQAARSELITSCPMRISGILAF